MIMSANLAVLGCYEKSYMNNDCKYHVYKIFTKCLRMLIQYCLHEKSNLNILNHSNLNVLTDILILDIT